MAEPPPIIVLCFCSRCGFSLPIPGTDPVLPRGAHQHRDERGFFCPSPVEPLTYALSPTPDSGPNPEFDPY